MPSYEGRLELTWTNKGLRLLAHEDGSYEWLDPSDYRVAEVRLLHDVATVEAVGNKRAADNLLIRGDALHALTSLTRLPEFAQEYLGKVKLAYLDPPFNTQQSFLHYDDALEHSVWLTMMRDRLLQIQDLLAPDGSVWVHLDDAEMAYCKVMMDEIFGRENFVATVIWQKAYTVRNDTKGLSVDHDYLLVYSKGEGWQPNLLPRSAAMDARYRNPDGDERGPWKATPLTCNKSEVERPNLAYTLVDPLSGESWPHNPNTVWRYSKETMAELFNERRIAAPRKPGGQPALKRFLSEVGDSKPRTLWTFEDVGHNHEAREESKKLFPLQPAFATPKPERLLRRVIHLSTDPDDVVLDCFLGSGTTAAVAHKMGRRWIGVECSTDTVERYTEPRLRKVVEGRDPGGITDAVGWTSGGGFRVLEVASSMFEADGGMVFLPDSMTNGALAEATAAQLGFEYQADPPFAGRKGRTRLAVVDGVVNESVVRLFVDALPQEERVVVCGTGIDPEARTVLRELRPGSTLRKIPAALLSEYRTPRSSRLDRLRLQDGKQALAEVGD